VDIKLAENIRKFRKERRLTQEQLAEVLGVTTGAVHKWESGMSIPDIGLIVEMADFFNTSVDVLLGYKMKDNHIKTTIERMEEMCRNSDREALTEAEKLLKKYPNSFAAVNACAGIYVFFGVGNGKEKECRRALELYEQARILIDQNTDPGISEETILGNMATVYLLIGEYEKAVDMLKKHNPNGMFSDNIGLIMALYLNKHKEAAPYLIQGVFSGYSTISNSILGYTAVLCAENKYSTAKKLIVTVLDLIKGIFENNTISFVDKEYSMGYILLAAVSLKMGERDEAVELIKKTVYHTKRFDSAPNYGVGELNFDVPEDFTVISRDILGDSAKESVETMLKFINDPEINELWNSFYESEEENQSENTPSATN
jgi:transcriptional regulator with XRE-family HTH domain